VSPAVDAWLGSVLVQVKAGLGGAAAAVTGSAFWQAWIGPNIGWIGLGIGLVGGILIYRGWTQKKLPFQKQITPQTYQHAPTTAPPQVIPTPSTQTTTPEEKVEKEVEA